jgi:hypothetical protein
MATDGTEDPVPAGAGGPSSVSGVPGCRGPACTEYHALVIGNNAYKPGQFKALDHCVQDAEDMAALLASKGYAVTLVLNGTKAKMVEALLQFQEPIADGCTSVVHFSGHGVACQTMRPELPMDSCLVPVDGMRELLSVMPVDCLWLCESFCWYSALLVTQARGTIPTAGCL